MNENWLDEIEQYLGGEMDPDEQSLFESKLKTNEELAGIFAIYQAFGSYHEDAPSTPLTEEDRKEEERLKNTLKGLMNLQTPTEEFLVTQKKKLQGLDKKTTAPVIGFNWKKLAIAATISGLILATTFIIFEKNKKPRDIDNITLNDAKEKYIADSIAQRKLILKKVNDFLAKDELISYEKQINVLKYSLGFGEKEEKLPVRIYSLDPAISKIEEKISIIAEVLFPAKDSLRAIPPQKQSVSPIEETVLTFIKQNHHEFELKLDSLRLEKDSLNNLQNKYIFHNDTVLVYLPSTTDVKIVQIDSEHYMHLYKKVYECRKYSYLSSLKEVKNSTIVNRINSIISMNAN